MKFKNLRFFSAFIFLFAYVSASYAITSFPSGTRPVWHNPLTGQSVTLSEFYVYLPRTPGLHWVFFGEKEFALILQQTGYLILDDLPPKFGPLDYWQSWGPLDSFDLQSDESPRKKICGREMSTGKAFGDRGRTYDFIEFFVAANKNLGVLTAIAVFQERDKAIPVNEKVFCPLVESFFPKGQPFYPPESGEWNNPLSEKKIILPPQTEIVMEDVTANGGGTYQAYHLTRGQVRISLQKMLHYSTYPGVDNADRKDLPENTVFQWRDAGYEVTTFEKAGFSKREAQFAGSTADGGKIEGFAFNYQTKDERVLVRVWRTDGEVLDKDGRNWAAELFNSSIAD